MEIYNYNNINDKEDEYLQLQNIIESKRNMLLKKQKKLQKISKQNVFLENIKNDYLKYNNYIVKQKEDQITALNLLNNYIEDLNRSGQLSKHNIQDAKAEQNKIVKELNSVKHGLDKIMNESKNINNSLLNKKTT
jgi:chromosome segregation ATPase